LQPTSQQSPVPVPPGDEALPFNFVAGAEGLKVWGSRQKALHGAFLGSYGRANPDMQVNIYLDTLSLDL